MSWNVTDFPRQPFWPLVKVWSPDGLVVPGDRDVVSDQVTITGNALYHRGSVLGRLTDGRYTLARLAALDGSSCPVAILAATVDPTEGDVSAGIYVSGEFNVNCLTFGDGITPALAQWALRLQSIYVSGNIPAA